MQMQKEIPPFVTFERKAKQNMEKSIAAGMPQYDNVIYIKVIPSGGGGRDVFEDEAENYLAKKKRECAQNAYNPEWLAGFVQKYEAYKQGIELPPDGTALEMLPFLSPAEIAQLKAMNIHTLEMACEMNETAIGMFGMGGRTLRDKFHAYRDSAKDVGKIVERISAIEADVRDKDDIIKRQAEQIKELESLVPKRPAKAA